MKRIVSLNLIILLLVLTAYGQQIKKEIDSQWKGKRVAFLGDSMTDKNRDPSTTVYWKYLQETLGLEPLVYGINGHQWNGIYKQALKLKQEQGSKIDAIVIFAGTNDYNHGLPLGQFYDVIAKKTNHNGTIQNRKYRILKEDDLSFCGRINKVMSFLKSNYADQQIIIMTPIHRGFATFGEKNVQPAENYSNALGLFIDDYVNVLKQASSVWSIPLIDLYSLSGLFPTKESNYKYFANPERDRLHLNSLGNYRLAQTIQYQLLNLPSTFRIE